MPPSQFLADQLTLSQPRGGGHIMPTTLLRAPLIFRPCDGPGKGQLIVKCLLGVFNFFQKNERKQVDLRYHSSKVEFVCSFFGSMLEKIISILSDC